MTAQRQRLDLPGNRPLVLDDPTQAWTVAAGAVYLFVVRTTEGRATGAREFLVQLGPGDGLFGMDLYATDDPSVGSDGADREGVALLAVGRPGTVLEAAADADGMVDPEVVTAWTHTLAAGMSDPAPRLAVEIGAGREVDTLDGEGYRHGAGPVWVRVTQGALLLGGRSGAVVDPGIGALPLSSASWLRSTGPARLVVEDPPAGRVPVASLAGLHTVVLRTLQHEVDDVRAARRRRARDRSVADADALDSGLRELVAFVDHGGLPADAGTAQASSNPLLAACRLVGESLGVTVSAPPAWQAGARDQLTAIARTSRLRERPVLLEAGWWRTVSGPLLGFVEATDQPVALLPDRRRQAYQLVDPLTGHRTRVTASVAATLSPTAHTLYRPFPARPLTALDLVRFGTRSGAGDIATIVAMGLLGGLLALVVPLASGALFNHFIPDRDLRGVVPIALAMLASVVATAVFQVVRSIAVARLGARMDEQLEAAVWDRLLSLPVTFFRQYASGDLAVRATSIGAMRQVLSSVVTTSILGSVFSVFSLGLLFTYDARLALVVTGLLAAAVLAGAASFVVQMRDRREAAAVRGRQAGLVFEMLSGITKLRVSGAEARAFSVWTRLVRGASARRAQRAAMALNVAYAALPLLVLVVVFPLAVSLDPPMSGGTFIAFNAALSQVVGAVLGLAAAVSGTAQVVPLFERVRPIVEALPETERGHADPGELEGDIDVADVSFRYREDGPLVLQNVSFRARPGEFVALVGASGSGKSTILRLLLGFERPESGSVYLDAQDLATLDLPAVRRQMGVVLQSGQLSTGTIFSSIVGASPFSMDEAWEAARGAGLDDDIRRMPMGMHTLVMEGGAGLSGGQRQRLLIARAIVAKPRVLLFDEATSALDNRTQAVVTESLTRLNTTRIVIAHRLSTVVRADQIHVVDGGRIVESGRYEELMARGGAFAALAARQLS